MKTAEGTWVLNHECIQGLWESEIITIEVDGRLVTPDVALETQPDLILVRGMSGLTLDVVNIDAEIWTLRPQPQL